ncbi:protein-lysine N-methyltransferase EEF2KMT [Arctopsyche grandis]|uniref:protein-lysine N-methyltransferase EEF2KMT n=1 Tax=Arctopsyche grandis TaxID=121162 RepID=UPI00406D7FD9
MELLSRQVLCCTPLPQLHLKKILTNISWDDQVILLTKTVKHPIIAEKPISITYQIAFMKKIIEFLTEAQIEIHDDIYDTHCQVLLKDKLKNSYHYKHYKVSDDDSSIISLKENSNLISDGTTGLHTWEASVILSEWCMQNAESLFDKNILELGSGAGLVGILTYKLCQPKYMCMSDCHEAVLGLLEQNVSINQDDDDECLNLAHGNAIMQMSKRNTTKRLGIIKLPWEEVEDFPSKTVPYPDLVVAADVVYDSSIFQPLIGAFKYFLNAKRKCEIILVNTIRNTNTIDLFSKYLEESNLAILKINQPEPLHFYWPSNLNTIIYKISNKQQI